MSKRLPTRHRRAPARQYAGMVGPIVESRAEQTLASHDGGLLERARTQWQFGDWQSLAQINLDTLEHYPERAKLALLAAAGRLQTGGNDSEARQLIRLAQSWGTSRKLINQILIAGVHNSLGRAAAISNQRQRASQHFENAITVGMPGSDTKLLTRARSSEQVQQLSSPISEDYLKTSSDKAITQIGKLAPVGQDIEIIHDIPKQQRVDDIRQKKQVKTAPHISKFSGDANIDDFIVDIEPFFYGYSITYVDIGAFVGEILLKLHQSKKIKIREAHLFEPNPNSYEKLKNNVTSINISKLHTYNYALGKEDGELYLSSARSMTKVIRKPEIKENQTGVFKINCYPLDKLIDLFTDHHINLLKIDVEGIELDVLEGTQQLLKEQRVDVIYIEVGFNKNGTQQTYFGLLDNFLQKSGYRVFKIYEQKNEWMKDSPLLRRCNFAYMSAQFAAANPYNTKQELMRLKEEIALLKVN